MRITRPFVLLALAALLAPHAEASRTSVWESNPPAAVLTTTNAAGLLAPLAPAGSLESIAADAEPVEPLHFDLGDVVLVESPRERSFRIGLADVVEPPALRGPPALDEDSRQAFELCDPETRVRGFELLPPLRVGASPSLSLWSRQACSFSCREVASDSRYDPWGLCLGLSDKPCSYYADKIDEYLEGNARLNRDSSRIPVTIEKVLVSPVTALLRLGESEGKLGYRFVSALTNPQTQLAPGTSVESEVGDLLTEAAGVGGDVALLAPLSRLAGRGLRSAAETLPRLSARGRAPAAGEMVPSGAGPGAALRNGPEFLTAEHHTIPEYMGGRANQPKATLSRTTHDEYHELLDNWGVSEAARRSPAPRSYGGPTRPWGRENAGLIQFAMRGPKQRQFLVDNLRETYKGHGIYEDVKDIFEKEAARFVRKGVEGE
ncbi:MAG: hypothetical protein ACYC4P_20565 [Thermoanaerobaculia bacterium]